MLLTFPFGGAFLWCLSLAKQRKALGEAEKKTQKKSKFPGPCRARDPFHEIAVRPVGSSAARNPGLTNRAVTFPFDKDGTAALLQSGVAPESFTSFDHFVMSARMIAASASGVVYIASTP